MNPVLPLGLFALIARIVLTSPFFFQQWIPPESQVLCLMLSWFQNTHRDLAVSWGEGPQVFVLLCGEGSADRVSRLQKVREKTAFQRALKGQGSYTKPRGLGKGHLRLKKQLWKDLSVSMPWALVSVSVYTVCNVWRWEGRLEVRRLWRWSPDRWSRVCRFRLRSVGRGRGGMETDGYRDVWGQFAPVGKS